MKKALVIEKTTINPPGKPRFKVKRTEEEISQFTKDLPTLTTEEEFCQQLLVEGFVQSYVDFYHLTQRSGDSIKIKYFTIIMTSIEFF